MRALEVLKPGMLSLIEDRGRFGYGEIGITQSGTADRYSAALANRLLLNDPDAPVLEIAMGGVELRAVGELELAVTGAQAPMWIDDRAAELWRTWRIHPGQRLRLGMARRGLRLYLAVRGGFEALRWLGSASVCLRDRLGSPITVGERLRVAQAPPLEHPRRLPPRMIPSLDEELVLRLVEGYQAEEFGAERLRRFYEGQYRVGGASDRMGCRLEGEAILHDLEILSEPIAYGAVQIPGDGHPIVLLSERQSIGGYPKVGSVLPMDCYRLAQAQPGTRVRFRPVTLEEARVLDWRLRRLLEEPCEWPRA